MKILCMKDIVENGKSRAVASLTEKDLEDVELLKKLKSLEADLKDCGMIVRKDGVFEIVEVEDMKTVDANKILLDGTPLSNGLAEFVSQVEAEIAEYRALRAEAEAKKPKEHEETEDERLERLRREEPDLYNWEMHGIEPTESGYYD